MVVIVVLEKGEVVRKVLREFRLEVEGWLTPEHPGDHQFTPSSDIPGICQKCRWIKPDSTRARARARDILDALDGHSVTTEG